MFIDVTETCQNRVCFDNFVKEIIIRRRIRKESISCRYAEYYKIYQIRSEGFDMRVMHEVGGIRGKEAGEGEKGSPKLGPVV